MSQALITKYTDAVLAFEFKENAPNSVAADQCGDAEVATFVERTLGMLTKSKSEILVLFGLGTGTCAAALATALPEDARLIVCETDTTVARNFLNANPQWKEPDSACCVIGDISLWAQFLLLAAAGATPENSQTALNPELSDDLRKQYQSLQRLFLKARPHQAINSSYLSHVGVQAPDLSIGAILSPDEPNLDTYFSQFPDWIKEVVVIWDSEEVPDTDYSCQVPVKHFAQPLKDFSAQRTRMLEECEGEWVLYLDGDEMFSEDVWSLFTALLLIKRLEAVYFPRMTLYPDESNCKVGYGLWPDLQLRLFKNTDAVAFERPIHEKVTGIEGRVAIALDAPILHYSRIRKNPEELAAKLRRFDEASGEQIQHLLNDDYPSLDRSNFPEASFIMGALQTLLLEENPA